MENNGANAAEKARRWRIVLEHLKTNGATSRGKAIGTAATKTALRMPNPDFEGMWKRGFIEWFRPEDSRLWLCYALVNELPADPVAAPVLRRFREEQSESI